MDRERERERDRWWKEETKKGTHVTHGGTGGRGDGEDGGLSWKEVFISKMNCLKAT